MMVDAAILMGDKGRSRPIRGENKNFLDLNGLPLFMYVLQSLEKAKHVDRIFVVGDRSRIQHVLRKYAASFLSPDKIVILDQDNTLFDNAMAAFEASARTDISSQSRGGAEPDDERAILYLGGDMPLILPQEIDEFIEKCDLKRFDYFLGMSTEQGLKAFYPTKRQRGIKMAYFYVREKKFRINNLHLAKPLKIKTRLNLQKLYDYRHQKEFFNFVKLLWVFCHLHLSLQGIVYYLILHCNLFMARVGIEWVTRPFRRLISVKDAERVLGDVLGCRLAIVETSLVGAALDVDNEKDYVTISAMFDQWRTFQQRLVNECTVESKRTIRTAS